MTPDELSRAVLAAVRCALDDGEFAARRPPAEPVPTPVDAGLRRARGTTRGDFATVVAMRLAASTGQPPRHVARVLARRLADHPAIARVDVAEPGFLNITLAAPAHADLVRVVRAQGSRYGHSDALAREPITPITRTAEKRRDPRSAACERLLRACGAATRPAPDSSPDGSDGPDDSHGPHGHARPYGHAPHGHALDRPHGHALDDHVLDRLGPDAAAWALVRHPAGDPPDLDPATHLPQREHNPLFRIRYAHARTRALLRNAADLGFGPAEGVYARPVETTLLGAVADYPRVVEAAARHRAPDRLARALEALADAFFDFHDGVPVLPRGDEKPSAAHRARLALADATGTVLAGGLTLLGVSAPDHL